jgi:O-antigen/teichoic acid export membrane protein
MTDGVRPLPGTLTAQTVRAVAWVALFELARGLLYAAMPAVVARFGTARDVGLAELVFAIYYVAAPFVEAGSGAAIIQRPGASRGFLATVFATNAATGAAVALILWLGAALLASGAHFDPRVVPLLRGLAPCMLMAGLTVVPQNLLARRMAFGTLTAVGVAATIASGVVAVLLARRGLGAYAIVAALVAHSGTTLIGTWIGARWWPSWRFERGELAGLLRFSLPNAGARLVGNFAGQFERFLVGGVMGSATLGLYGAVRGLARTPFLQLMQVSDRVLLPALSSLQHDLPRTRAYYLTAVRNELALLGPLIVLVGATAAVLVPMVYGPRWSDAVILVPLVAFITVRTCTNHSVGAVFLAQGRPGLQLLWSALNIPLMLLYFLVGHHWGLTGFIAAWASIGIIGWAIPHVLSCRLIGMRFRDFLAGIAPVVSALGLAAVLWTASLWLVPVLRTARWRLAAFAPLALLGYAGILWMCDRRLVLELYGAIRGAILSPRERIARG